MAAASLFNRKHSSLPCNTCAFFPCCLPLVQADLTHAALAAGPLDVSPNLMQQLGALLGGGDKAAGAEGGAGTAEGDTMLANLRGLQEQVALLDRIQNIRWALLGAGVALGSTGWVVGGVYVWDWV